MKKIIFLLLLAQTISFITADSGCQQYSDLWGEKGLTHTQCYCKCEGYMQVSTNRRKCTECNHFRVPIKIENGSSKSKSTTITVTTKTAPAK